MAIASQNNHVIKCRTLRLCPAGVTRTNCFACVVCQCLSHHMLFPTHLLQLSRLARTSKKKTLTEAALVVWVSWGLTSGPPDSRHPLTDTWVGNLRGCVDSVPREWRYFQLMDGRSPYSNWKPVYRWTGPQTKRIHFEKLNVLLRLWALYDNFHKTTSVTMKTAQLIL